MKEKLNNYKTYLINLKKSQVYYNYLVPLTDYLLEKNLQFETLTKELLAQYFSDKKYSSNSINNVIKACRDFARFNKIEIHPCFEIKMLEVEQRERKYITYEELLTGIKHYATYSNRGMSADKCSVILKFCFFTSIRKGELLTLKRENIDLVNSSALVWGAKDKTERTVYFPNTFSKELVDYFNSEKEDINAFNISLAEFNYLVRKIGKYISKDISPHSLRHSGAKYMVKKNISPVAMQRIMGHNSLTTTLIYCRIDDKQAQDIYKQQIG